MNYLVWRVRELVCVWLLIRVSSERHLGEPQLYQREKGGGGERGERGKEWEEINVYRKRDIAKAESYIQTLHNPNSPVLEVVQISESFGLVNVYIFNGAYSIFYLMHHKILMNIITYMVRISKSSD